MPKGKDQYQALPGYEKLTWTDHLRGSVTPDMPRTNPETGAVENPRREYLRERIAVRQKEAEESQKMQAAEMKRHLEDTDKDKD